MHQDSLLSIVLQTYTLWKVFKYKWINIILKVFNGVSYAHQGCIYLITDIEKKQ